jgi:hypothetical protein
MKNNLILNNLEILIGSRTTVSWHKNLQKRLQIFENDNICFRFEKIASELKSFQVISMIEFDLAHEA